jgi:hypothetical protein
MAERLSALRTGRALLPKNIIFFLLLVFILLEADKPQGLVWPEGLGELKKYIHRIGSRTRDLPVNNTVPRNEMIMPEIWLPPSTVTLVQRTLPVQLTEMPVPNP